MMLAVMVVKIAVAINSHERVAGGRWEGGYQSLSRTVVTVRSDC